MQDPGDLQSPETAQRSQRIIIIGAGLTGLAIAHGLKKNNIPYVIVDREYVPRDRNWAITLGWALPLLQNLLPEEIYNTLQQCQPDPTLNPKTAGQVGVLVRDGISGETKSLSRFPVIRRLNHQKTKQHWSTGLNVLRGKRLIDITLGQNENWVKAHFDDGTTETGTTIIGADGGASYVRRWLLGDLAIPETLPCEFMNFSFTLPADIALRVDKELNPTVDAGIHPTNMYLGIFLLDKPDLAKPEGWVFYILSIWPLGETVGSSSSSSRLGELRLRTDNWFDLFKTVVENIPDDTEVKPDQLRIWKTKLWNNYSGRVTLAGDAAHSMTFHRGQGGNLGIKDADELVNAMVAVQKRVATLPEAINSYDQGALLRSEEVEISRKCTMAFLDYENFDNSPLFKLGVNPMSKT